MAELTYRKPDPVPPTETTYKDTSPLTFEEMDGNWKSLDDDIQTAKEQALIYSIIFS